LHISDRKDRQFRKAADSFYKTPTQTPLSTGICIGKHIPWSDFMSIFFGTWLYVCY